MPKGEESVRQHAEALNQLSELVSSTFEKGYNQAIRDLLDGIGEIARSMSRDMSYPIGNRAPVWPELDKNVLWYAGKRANLRGSRFVALLQKLLEAEGEIIPTAELLEFYGTIDGLKSAIYALRKILAKKMPEIEIISAGNGYRISINDSL